jgi:hypothetical protein
VPGELRVAVVECEDVPVMFKACRRRTVSDHGGMGRTRTSSRLATRAKFDGVFCDRALLNKRAEHHVCAQVRDDDRRAAVVCVEHGPELVRARRENPMTQGWEEVRRYPAGDGLHEYVVLKGRTHDGRVKVERRKMKFPVLTRGEREYLEQLARR